ncbi:MAG: succinate dehydrogenase assembly factor 2 [Geminicoccaceae bacterium]|nr:succinate dehydrogenase assembly factor 2 [Geminicoccaceae bacterium]MCB9945609.1 succinate dehydrogenase assembly factor 2 [Geminicoccaceae bacterium]
MSETLEIRRRRLLHRSRYRGFREADIIFGRFADRYLASLDLEELDQYEALIEEADQDVYAWVQGTAELPARHDNGVFARLRAAETGPA